MRRVRILFSTWPLPWALLCALAGVWACGGARPTLATPWVVGPNCPAAELGEELGRSTLLVGGQMDDDAFDSAPFDLRYVYLVGPVPTSPCATCAHACEAGGEACANAAGGCPWWGCWQWDGAPPGQYVRDLIAQTETAGAIPMFTYYVWLSVAETAEGMAELDALADGARLARYLADWRFFARAVASATTGPVIAHVEPDLWGFGQQRSDDPAATPVAVSAGVAPECAGLPDDLSGLARCMLAIARAEAPNLLIGFHASAWGAGADALSSTDPHLNVAAHAADTARFLRALGADQADLVVVEMSDHDAGADGAAWDPTDRTLPSFERALTWVARLTEALDLPALWWQVPYGHAGLPNTCGAYEDDRVAYVFDHPERFAEADAVGVAFGAGAECMTTPSTDGGYFVERARTYFREGPPRLCDPVGDD